MLSILLSACTGYAPTEKLIGQDRAALIKALGQPERETESDGYKKLHFPRGPGGSDTYFVYINDNDEVVRWEQVLTEEQLNKIKSGMTRDQVIDLIGITTNTSKLGRGRGYVWHYRYKTPQCRSFVIEFTSEDIVRSAGYRFRPGRKCKYVGPG